jgi:transcriptional regulator with XRE-family HTH domain
VANTTIGMRLETARKARGISIRQLQISLRNRKGPVEGSSPDSVYAYFEGRRKPPVEFLEAAARELGVRAAWLTHEDGGMTADEDTIREAGAALLESTQQQSELSRLIAESVPELLGWPRAARAVFLETWTRYFSGFSKPLGTTEYQMGKVAQRLYGLVTRPLLVEPGLRRPFGSGFETSEGFEDYLLLSMQALMRAMPEAGQGDYLDPETFPRSEQEPPRKEKQQRKPPARKRPKSPPRRKG